MCSWPRAFWTMMVCSYSMSASHALIHLSGYRTSSMYGYPRSIKACLETRRSGILVLPLLG